MSTPKNPPHIAVHYFIGLTGLWHLKARRYSADDRDLYLLTDGEDVYVRLDVVKTESLRAVDRGREQTIRAFWAAVCESRADNLEANALRAESFPDFKPEWAEWAAARREEAEQLREWADEAMS